MICKVPKHSSRTALILDDGHEVSFFALNKELDRIARVVGHQKVVINICNNSFETIAGYLGFLKAGIPQILLSEKVSTENFRRVLDAYDPPLVYLPAECRSLLNQGTELYRFGQNLLVLLDTSSFQRLHESLRLLLPTSGSTGNPKMVRLSEENLSSNALAIAQYLTIDDGHRAITTLPLSYAFGLSILNSHLVQAGSIVLSRSSPTEASFWKTLRETQVTSFSGVPYTYEILGRLGINRLDLPNLRYFTQAGGQLKPNVAEAFVDFARNKKKQFIMMYGQTEATARMSYLPWRYAKKKIGSIGIPIPGGEFWLEDDNGEIVSEPGTPGELVYRGANVSLGYAESFQDLAKGDENRGVLHTADIAKRDEDGFYTIVGRKQRFLKMFGYRVNLDDIEEIAGSAGFEAVCAGKDGLICIFVTDGQARTVIPDVLRKKTGFPLGAFKICLINDIPRNEVGKILYSQIERYIDESTSS